jgi:hypothetical protein
MVIEIVDLPTKVVIFKSYVSLPEGMFDGLYSYTRSLVIGCNML